MSIDGMRANNDYAKRNLSGGKAFTSPVPDSVEGTIVFDLLVLRNGQEIHDAQLTFESGEVVEYSACRNEEVLASMLKTDEGARPVGKLGIEMNRGTDQFTYNMLFNKKMSDTIHIALGNALEECIPDDYEFNESVRYANMLVDMS